LGSDVAITLGHSACYFGLRVTNNRLHASIIIKLIDAQQLPRGFSDTTHASCYHHHHVTRRSKQDVANYDGAYIMLGFRPVSPSLSNEIRSDGTRTQRSSLRHSHQPAPLRCLSQSLNSDLHWMQQHVLLFNSLSATRR
jgi:hypothetical protein